MQIKISGQHINVTAPLKNYISEKFKRIERHFDSVTATTVVLHVERQQHLAEATVNAKGVRLHANAKANDMYAAIDALVAKVTRQIRRRKERITDHHRNGGVLRKKQGLK